MRHEVTIQICPNADKSEFGIRCLLIVCSKRPSIQMPDHYIDVVLEDLPYLEDFEYD